MSNRAEKERRRQQRIARQQEETRRAGRRRERWWWAGIAAMFVATAVVLVVGLSNRGGHDDPGLLEPVSHGAAAKAAVPVKGVPKQIAANLEEGNRVVDGQVSARLASLKGVPVVVNMWASWCPNCKAEFPLFQRLSTKYQRRVAFLGLDSQDERSKAEGFLHDFPVNYPSVFDQSAEQALSIGAGRGWPTTIFYDRSGRQTFVRQGGYTTEASLEADLRRYALGT